MISALLFSIILYNADASLLTAEQISLAGAGSLNSRSANATSFNPAALSLEADLQMGGGIYRGDFSSSQDQSGYNVWFKDSVSDSFDSQRNKAVRSKFDGLLGYSYSAVFSYTDNKIGNQEYKEYRLAVAKLLSRKLSLGMDLSYFGLGRNYLESKAWVGTLGLVYNVNRKLILGLSGINLLNTKEDLNLSAVANGQAIRLGGRYLISSLIWAYFDVDRHLDYEDLQKWSYGLGLESQIKEFFLFRLGIFRNDIDDSTSWGTGLSFNGPKLKMAYGLQINKDRDSVLHMVDLQLPLW